jgi:hypothetical protein
MVRLFILLPNKKGMISVEIVIYAGMDISLFFVSLAQKSIKMYGSV